MPVKNVKTAFYLNEILFDLSINAKMLFMAFPKALDNKEIHLLLIGRASFGFRVNSTSLQRYRPVADMYYQDSFLFYQKPQYMQNNLFSPPTHFLDESRICNPSQPCFMTKQTSAFTQPEAFNANLPSQFPFSYGTDPRALLPSSSGKLRIPGKSKK